MRVLMLVSEAPPIQSGIARVAGELTERLRARGIYLDVLSANEIPRWTFKEFRLSSLGFRWSGIQRILSQYDVLHIHGTVPTFSDVALLFGRIGLNASHPGGAIVYTHHSDIDIAGLDLPVNIYNRTHRRLLRLADHIVASTPTYASLLEDGDRPGRVSAVRFGVDTDRFQNPGPKPERFNVLFVGQLRPYKGVDTLLRSWQHVDNADLHIVGDGHQKEELVALCKSLNLQSVHFHGSVGEKQLTEFYSNAHVLVLPSNRKAEAFGLVLLEGMAAGCVPVSSNLPGVADVVSTSGFTFPVGDSEALARILVDLRDNPEKRIQMSALAVARSYATSWDYTAEAYDGIYRQAYLGRQLERMLIRGFNPDILQNWLGSVVHQARADRASLMLVQPGNRRLRVAASVGLPAEIANTVELQIGHRIAGYVAHSGRSMLLNRKKMPGIARLYANSRGLASSLVLPLHAGSERVGVLNVARGADRLSFTGADQEWLGRLAQQVAPILSPYLGHRSLLEAQRYVGQMSPAALQAAQARTLTPTVPAIPAAISARDLIEERIPSANGMAEAPSYFVPDTDLARTYNQG